MAERNNKSTNLINWLLGLIGVMILSTVGWLAIQTYEMEGGLSDVKGSVAVVSNELQLTSARVERIALALPITIATNALEDINAPIKGMVLSANPSQNKEGSWFSNVYLVDVKTSEAMAYNMPLRGKDDKTAIYAITGSVKSIDNQAKSFSHLKKASQNTGTVVSIPESINSDASFALREKTTEEYADTLSSMAGKPYRTRIDINKFTTWKQFAEALEKPNNLEAVTAIAKANSPHGSSLQHH